MVDKKSPGGVLFMAVNHAILLLLALLCIAPLVHVLAVSLSSSAAAAANRVLFWPVNLTDSSYRFLLQKRAFLLSLRVSALRLALGVPLTVLVTILAAYPLSRESRSFRWRTAYAWFLFVSVLFDGGLIPLYMTVRATGIMDTILGLVLPAAVQFFSIIVLLNFFRGIPRELEESAFIDGAGHLRVLLSMYLPVSKAAVATVTLFSIVYYWNEWFYGIIFMNNPDHYPLQSYLQTIIIAPSLLQSIQASQQLQSILKISDRTAKAAQIFLGALPLLLIYPFLQRYFTKGIVLGSVKG